MKTIFKRSFAIFLVAVMVFGAAPLSGFVGLELPDMPEFNGIKKLASSVSDFFDSFAPKAEAATSGKCGENLTWTFDGSTGTLTISGTGDMYNWTSDLKTPWYHSRSIIKIVKILDGTTSISDSTFQECLNITHVTISDSVTSIGKNAFCDCSALVSITIGNGVKIIDDYALYKCPATNITIPDSVTIIGDYAFGGCLGITSLTIPDSVISIGICAFASCSNLKNLTIGNSLESIAAYSFLKCTSLTSLVIPENVNGIGLSAFNGCSSLTNLIISDGVRTIKDEAFRGCSNLSNVSIGNDVTTIGGNAFYQTEIYNNFSNWDDGNVLYIDNYLIKAKNFLGSYAIKHGTKTIAQAAFSDCKDIAGISIPSSVTNIGKSAFSRCIGITNISIPSSVTHIEEHVFQSCGNLTSISIPDTVTCIDNAAFSSCTKLTNITIPESVVNIGDRAFSVCQSLTNISIPNNITRIGNETFSNCKKLKSIIITDSVTTIGNSAFSNCDSLENIIIPDSVTTIGNRAFSNCDSLESIIIPDSVTSMGIYIFDDCLNLKKATIGNGITSIPGGLFANCTALSSVTFGNKVNKIEEQAFYNTALYNDASNWENDVLYVDNCLMEARNSISGSYVIKEGTKLIANSAFRNCINLTSVEIPDGVRGIGNGAFYNCQSLTNVNIPDSVTRVGPNAFDYSQIDGVYQEDNGIYLDNWLICGSSGDCSIKEGTKGVADYAFYDRKYLTSIIIPDSILYIGDRVFEGCDRLASINVDPSNTVYSSDEHGVLFNKDKTELILCPKSFLTSNYTIPDSVKYIDDYAFSENKSITIISIPDSVISIGDYAFDACTKLKSITIPDSVTHIGERAFLNCITLSNVIIGNGVVTIEDGAFCQNNFKNVTIGKSVRFIGSDAFDSLKLSNIYYFGNEEEWDNIIISSDDNFRYAIVNLKNPKTSFKFDKEEYVLSAEKEIVVNGKITVENDDINKITPTYEVSNSNGLKVISDTFNVISETEAEFSVKIKGLKDGKYTLTVKNGNASAKCDIIVGKISELVIQFEDIKDNLYSLNGFFFDSIGNYYNNALEVIVKLTNQVKLEYLLTEFTEKEKENAAFKVKFVVEVNSGFSFDGAGKRQIEFVYDPLEFRQGEEIKLNIHQENENAQNLTVTYKAYIDDVLKHTGTETSKIMSYQEKYTLEHISALTDKKGYYPVLNDSFAQNMIPMEDSRYYKWNKFLSDGLVGTAANYLTGDLDEENAYKLVIADLINGMYDEETLEEASLTIYSEAFTNVVTQAAGAIVESALEDSYIREKLGKLDVKDFIKVFTGGASSEAISVFKAVLNTEKGKNKMLTALSGVSLVDNGLFILEEAGLILDSYNNYIRAVNAMSAMNTFAQMDKALIDVFVAMYGCSYNNPTLKKALNDYLSHMNDTRANRILKIVKCYVDSNITSLSKTVFKSIQMIYSYGLRDVIAKSVSAFFKYAGEFISGIDFGVYVFDFLWSSSDYDAAMSRVVAAGHMSVVLEKAIERLGDNIKVTKSFSNAVVLDRALNLFGEVEKYAYKHFIDALNAEGNCIFLTDSLSVKLFGDRTDDYKKEIADLLVESAKLESLNCHNLRLERIASKVTGLTPSNTSERILEPDFKIVCVRCPVDVYIYDGTTLIASVVGNKITFIANGIKALSYYDEKYICLPSTVDYDIKIEATENGKMNYSVFEYDEDGCLTREVAYEDIVLEKGQIFTGSVNDEPLTPAENYDLETNGGKIDKRKDSADGYDFTQDVDIKLAGNADVGLNVPTQFKLLCSNLPQDAKINWTCNDSSIKLTPSDDGLSCEIIAENVGSAVLTASIAGTDIASELEITVSEKTYTINWYIGDSTTTQSYKYGQKVEIPNISVPEGYSFLRWSSETPETMPAKNISIMAVLQKIKYLCSDCGNEFDNETMYNEHVSYEETKKGAQVTIINPSNNTISYGDSIILHAELSEGLPVGWKIVWESDNDNFSYSVSDDGTTCMISPSKSGNTIFTASVYDADGNEVSTDEQTMTAKAGFFDKIIAFFKKLFGLTKTIPQVFKGII